MLDASGTVCNPISKLTFIVTATEIKHSLQRASRGTSMRIQQTQNEPKKVNWTNGPTITQPKAGHCKKKTKFLKKNLGK